MAKQSELASQERPCPGCGFPEQVAFFEARDAPVDVGVQWESAAAARNCPRGDIRLAFCRKCGLIANVLFDPALLCSNQNYENPLDHSPTFRAYARGLAEQLIQRYNIREKTVAEIGCGDGAFLRTLCELGNNRGLGFDPAHTRGEDHGDEVDSQVTFIADEYSAKHADREADFLCCRHLLDHISTPREFVSRLRELIGGRPGSVAYFEVPECREIFLEPYPWLIIYEHCLYFTHESLARLFAACGYAVEQCGTAYGGTFAFVEARASGRRYPRSAALADLGALASAIETFPARHGQVLEKWHRRLGDLASAGERVVLWGAGARSVGFTSAVGAAEQIPYVVDLNPRKWGRYLSGTGQEIVPPAFLQEYRPSTVIIMNSIYKNEIENIARGLGIAPALLSL